MFLTTKQDTSLSLPLTGRDPLGTQVVWQYRARDVVPALTAASRLPEGFQLLLTALAWWPQFARTYGRRSSEQTKFFLLFEQAAARSCQLTDTPWRLPGSRRLSAGNHGVWAGVDPEKHYLLDSPLANGVWGIYRGPLVNARLLDAQNLLTRDVAHAIVGTTKQLSLHRLFSHLNKALDAAPGAATHIASQRSHGIVTGLVTLVTDIPSRDYIRRLFVSEEASPLSAALCRMAEETANLSSPERLVTRGQQRLAQRFREVLQRIEACERYLACVDASFESLCHETGRPLGQAANNLGVNMAALRLARARFLQSGSYVGLAEIRYRELCNAPLESRSAFTGWLLSHHAKVSAKRKASPWVEVREDGRINCRLAVERPAPEALAPATAWRNGYYLDALEGLAQELRVRETA